MITIDKMKLFRCPEKQLNDASRASNIIKSLAEMSEMRGKKMQRFQGSYLNELTRWMKKADRELLLHALGLLASETDIPTIEGFFEKYIAEMGPRRKGYLMVYVIATCVLGIGKGESDENISRSLNELARMVNGY